MLLDNLVKLKPVELHIVAVAGIGKTFGDPDALGVTLPIAAPPGKMRLYHEVIFVLKGEPAVFL